MEMQDKYIDIKLYNKINIETNITYSFNIDGTYIRIINKTFNYEN